MANKYIISGATYNGDGTSSAEAASNGAAGAWNTMNYFTGTTPAYGTLSAGDVVYIRSKTAANANIDITIGGNVSIGSASGATNNWITWIIDNGVTWSGVNGEVKYRTASAYTITMRAYNRIIALSPDKFVIYEGTDTTAGGKKSFTITAPSYLENVKIDFSFASGYGAAISVYGDYHVATIKNATIKGNRRYALNALFVTDKNASILQLVNPDIELTNAADTAAVFSCGYTASSFQVFGGRIYGAGATTGVPLVRMNPSYESLTSTQIVGMTYPSTMSIYAVEPTGNTLIEMMGVDSGLGGVTSGRWGYADSRNDGYYPTLNAYLPNSTQTPWSWKVYPQWSGTDRPSQINTTKLFTDTAAAKTVTLDVLIADSISTASTRTFWIDLIYVDNTTGVTKYQTTFDHTAASLTTSTAAWSATTYGAVNLLKRKFSLTTATSVKQNTLITVLFRSAYTPGSANDICFVCPDITLS